MVHLVRGCAHFSLQHGVQLSGFHPLSLPPAPQVKGEGKRPSEVYPQGSESWPSSTPPLGFSLLQRALSGANSSKPPRSPDAFSFGGGESGGGVSCVCPVGNTKKCPQILYSGSKSAQEVEVSHCSVLTECRPAVRPASPLEHRPRLFLMLSRWIKVGLGFT